MTFRIYRLKINQITIAKTRKIFYFLTDNIKNSTFTVFGHEYFLELLKINHQNCFYIKKNNKIVSYISYIDNKNEIKMKEVLIKFVLKNFVKNIFLILLNFKFFFKIHLYPKNFIQLLHLVIKSNNRNANAKTQLHKKINEVHQIILSKYHGIYAMYENKNIIASKYYKKNNFKIFKKNFFYTFVKKKF